jgi:hypothetical protein
MRAKRARALRKLYAERYGEAPPKAQWTPVAGGFSVEPSKWRIWKSLFKTGELNGK